MRSQNGTYYPYGEEYTPTGQDGDKFATYFGDAATNLQYAKNRYYSSAMGRFLTPDPYRASGGPADPGSWNRYAYVGGDPVNSNDPAGLCSVVIGGFGQSPWNPSSANQLTFTAKVGAVAVFPYADSSLPTELASVVGQGLGKSNEATSVVYQAVMAAANGSSGPINVFTFSGGAQTFSAVYPLLPAGVQARINNVTYISPGSFQVGKLPSGNGKTTVYYDPSVLTWDFLVAGSVPTLATEVREDCGHDANCVFRTFQENLKKLAGENPCPTLQIYTAQPTYQWRFYPYFYDVSYAMNMMLNLIPVSPPPIPKMQIGFGLP